MALKIGKESPKLDLSVAGLLLRANDTPGLPLPLDFTKKAREIPINIGPATYTDMAVGLFRHLGLVAGQEAVEGVRKVVARASAELLEIDENRVPVYDQEQRRKYSRQVGGQVLTYLDVMRDITYEHYGSDVFNPKIDTLQQLMGKVVTDHTASFERLPDVG